MSVWMLSGQGAQKPGMGADLLHFSQCAHTFQIASEELDLDLANLAKEGSEEEVNDPYAAQALTMAISVGVGKLLLDEGFKPNAMLGFSLGQIGAMALSGALDERQAFRLLKVRARSMAQACREREGAMLALLRASEQDVLALCGECAQGDILAPANYNCPGQIVISGDAEAIGRAQERWGEQGGKSSRLNTAGGFHTALMEGAAQAVAQACEELDFKAPRFPVICNTDAKVFDVSQASSRLAAQAMGPVMFQQSVERLIRQGESEFIELGFGGVLCGLVKRIDRSSERVSLGSADELQQFLDARKRGIAQTLEGGQA